MIKIVAIGGSQGGITVLRKLVASLADDFVVPILIVQHIGASPSMLPEILNDADGKRAAFAVNGERLIAGRIYVAPPDHHMLLMEDRIELTRGPRENWARPAIDPLFRSVAQFHGTDAIGILLTGRLNDGTAGLYEIKLRGGTAIVQAPAEAESPDMPQSALDNVAVDFSLPIAEIPRLLTRLTSQTGEKSPIILGQRTMELEPKILRPSALTCPECGGAMREEAVGSLTRYRCHIGHIMTAEVMAATQLEVLENDLSSILRRLNERAELCRSIAAKYESAGNTLAAQSWRQASEEALAREGIAKALVESSWIHSEALQEAGE